LLYLPSQVDQKSINDLTQAINSINSTDAELEKLSAVYGMTYTPEPIQIFIDSYGGLVYQCLGLLGVMKRSTAPIHTIVTGCAMSCGFIISVAGHKRFAYDKSTFLYHQISTGFYGKAADLEDEVKEVKRLQKLIENHVIESTGLSKQQLKDNYKTKTDWFIDAKEALKYKIIDHIL
jgi:ATP-dependent Clp protease protease subunit